MTVNMKSREKQNANNKQQQQQRPIVVFEINAVLSIPFLLSKSLQPNKTSFRCDRSL